MRPSLNAIFGADSNQELAIPATLLLLQGSSKSRTLLKILSHRAASRWTKFID